jgi:fatty acid desaturase/membrane-associated phospholipid phosphatase
LALAVGADIVLLMVASGAQSPFLVLAAAALFAFTNNSLFGLLHEAVHGKFSSSARLNRVAGTIAAVFFPTSFTLQRSAHLTHHRNNRSELERFDYIGPDENIPLKTGQWFSILTGLYWLGIPLALCFYALFAELIPWKRLVRPGSRFATQTSAGEFLESLMRLPVWRVRAELALAFAVHAGMIWGLQLSLVGWLSCYGAFALAWSSLQYADHAFTRLDRCEGAWNLHVSWFTRRMFLNYHDHLEHHRDPDCRWRDLPGKVRDPDARVRFIAILYLMWRGPRLLPGSNQPAGRQQLLEWSVVACHAAVFGAAFGLVYGLSSLRYPMHAAYHAVATQLDHAIPFIPEAGIIYMSIVPLLLVTPVILGRSERTLPFLAAVIMQLLVAGMSFELFPVEAQIRPGIPPESLAAAVFGMADTMNLSGNELPSLHVALAISCAWACSSHLSVTGRALLWLWALAICISSLLIWEHWLADVVAGAAMAVLAMAFAYPRLVRALQRVEEAIIAHPASSVERS